MTISLPLESIEKTYKEMLAEQQLFARQRTELLAALEVFENLDKTLQRCQEMFQKPKRLLSRTKQEEKTKAFFCAQVHALARGQDRQAYSLSLLKALLFSSPADLGQIKFDLVEKKFLFIVITWLADFWPLLFESEEKVAARGVFYTKLLSLMVQEKLPPPVQASLSSILMPRFASLWFLGARGMPMRRLRLAHGEVLARLFFSTETPFDHVFSEKTKAEKKKIAFLAQGQSHGHGWSSISPVAKELYDKGHEIFLLTLQEDPSRADLPIEQITLPKGEEAIRSVRQLDLDVLFFCLSFDRHKEDEVMYLSRYRLARRQVTAFMNNTTTSLPFMDVVITSPSMDDPKQVEETFSEKTLLFMDELPFAFDPDTYFPKEKLSFTREDLDLPQEAKVICCGNSFVVKANEAFLSLLVRLLTKDPQAYLILMPSSGDQNVFLYHLYRAFLKEKVGLDRLRFIQPSSREKQYALLGLADLYLDCFPYSGANSLFDPLWCGVPVLCLQSEHKMRFRQGSAILQDMGLDLFVALRLEELEEKALSFLKVPPKEALGPKRVLSSSAFDGRAAKKIAQLLESL